MFTHTLLHLIFVYNFQINSLFPSFLLLFSLFFPTYCWCVTSPPILLQLPPLHTYTHIGSSSSRCVQEWCHGRPEALDSFFPTFFFFPPENIHRRRGSTRRKSAALISSQTALRASSSSDATIYGWLVEWGGFSESQPVMGVTTPSCLTPVGPGNRVCTSTRVILKHITGLDYQGYLNIPKKHVCIRSPQMLPC